MSGIVGLYHLDGQPATHADVLRMAKTLAHRGHGETITTCRSTGLGQLRSGRKDRPEFGKPTVGRSDGVRPCISADVRLDNRAELIAGMGLQTASFSDEELILMAYQRWGTACPRYLLGNFAFAIWDNDRQQLFCARDHIGVRPFYYYSSSTFFAYASEIKALLSLSGVPCRLNETRIADYLVPLLEDKEITFYKGIRRLPPAHWALVSRGGVHLERYWSLDAVSELRLSSNEGYDEAYLQTFTEAVRCRLSSSPPVGSFLSGGLDSSSITCVARNLLAEKGIAPLPTFSAIFPEVPQCDERPFIQAIHGQGGCDPHFVQADQVSPLDSLDAVLRRQDEPFFGPNLFMHHALYRKASEQGVGVLLDGIDGDTTISHGLGYMAEQARLGAWGELWGNVRGLAQNLGQSPFHIARKYVIGPLAPRRLRQGWRWLRRCGDRLAMMNPTIRADFAARTDLSDRCASFDTTWEVPPPTERLHHYQRLVGGILPFVLEILDRAGTMYGVEGRYPFCDKRLIELCFSLPPRQKICGGWTRVVARRAMKGILPEQVRWRKSKSSLSANFNRSLLRYEKETMDRIIYKDASVLDPYVSIENLKQVYSRFQVSGSHADAMTIWKAVTLALWLESSPVSLSPAAR